MRTVSARLVLLLVAGTLALLPGTRRALAQDEGEGPEYVPAEVAAAETVESSWDYLLRLGVGLTFGASSNVIGNADGNTWTVSFSLDGGADFHRMGHDWRNSLHVGENFTRTPLIDEFVKSSDDLDLESLYLYHLAGAPWFGPFGRFRVVTSVFAGSDVRPSQVTYAIAHVDGTVETVTADRLALTDPFQPLALKESAGVFLQPPPRDEFQLELLLGFGSHQTFATNQLAVNDDSSTPEIEVVELQNVIQAGTEGILNITGDLSGGKVSYHAGADVLIPFINDLPAGDNRSAVELTNIDLSAGVVFHLVDWASLEYQFHAVREPQLLDEYQIQNTLLLTIGYTFVDTRAERAAAEAAEADAGGGSAGATAPPADEPAVPPEP